MATIHRTDGSVELPDELPAVALRDLVFFPYMVLPLLIGRPASLAALARADAPEGAGLLLLVAQHTVECEVPTADDVHPVGTVARVVQSSVLPDGTRRVVLEGVGRVRVDRWLRPEGELRARVRPLVARERTDPDAATPPETEALVRSVLRKFEEYATLHERIAEELVATLRDVRDRVRLAHLVSGHILLDPPDKQALLECAEVEEQLRLLQRFLAREVEILQIEEKLDRQILAQMEADRRQFYLNEQLKAIHQELGVEAGEEWVDLERAVAAGELPDHARARAERELKRLRRLNPAAPEAAVIRTYLDWILALPWVGRSAEMLALDEAQALLDGAHHGLDEVKDRIVDHIAVLAQVGRLEGPILCLVGPPGVGKTSLGRSIAAALGREFVRVSLGGVRDEAEIRGHRRTYVGALPGRVLQGMRRSGTTNPVFMLDEVDKLARDVHGDPGSALLEVLDPEQNATFTDHYLELEYDLSDVLFVATANTLAGIPEPLRDRMEVIRLPGYLDTEKRVIVERFLWPRQRERHGLEASRVELAPEAVARVITEYTREAGVRELDRRISRIARKLARRKSEGGTLPLRIEADAIGEFLGPPPHLPPDLDTLRDRVGLANGLAWTAAGGELLDVEVAVVPGSGEVRLTGTLGDVMKESAVAALTWTRARARVLGLEHDFHTRVDVHVHIPEGATPKDGPSAGITMAVALISALTGVPTAPSVAMTGEITLRGRVLPVGGVREKAVAALRHGVARVILPAGNAPEIAQLPEEVRRGLDFVPVRSMDEVLVAALDRPLDHPRHHSPPETPLPLLPQ